MKLIGLIEALSQPGAYSHEAEDVSVIQTHISVVFLAGPYAYKIKKPVDLGFLDFTTLERRKRFCLEEVRLNRRLAPEVYLNVVPIVERDGEIRVGGDGEAIEYAVRMTRLDDERTFESLLSKGRLDANVVAQLGDLVARFHAGADHGPEIAPWGRFDVVAGNCRENFEQIEPYAGHAISPELLADLRRRTEDELLRRRDLIVSRAQAAIPCDTHGDLHLDHVYYYPDRPAPHDLLIIDCIEFNERFRYADPMADLAFLVMDLRFHHRPDLARVLVDAYFDDATDEGRDLLPLYAAYRAVVRGKVESIEVHEAEVPPGEKEAALKRARAHFLLAKGLLAPPGERPCLVLVGGLPGSGKSRLAERLERTAGFVRISSDRTRKTLAGIRPEQDAAAPFGEGIYESDWNDRTYAQCLEEAEQALFQGRRVLVDASFREERRRSQFLEAARQWRVPGLFLLCQADRKVIRERVTSPRGGASDADWKIYEQAEARWEPPDPTTEKSTRLIDTNGSEDATDRIAIEILQSEGLLE